MRASSRLAHMICIAFISGSERCKYCLLHTTRTLLLSYIPGLYLEAAAVIVASDMVAGAGVHRCCAHQLFHSVPGGLRESQITTYVCLVFEKLVTSIYTYLVYVVVCLRLLFVVVVFYSPIAITIQTNKQTT